MASKNPTFEESKQLDKAEQAVVKLTKTADGSPVESPLEEQK